jgi:hypothetical protein
MKTFVALFLCAFAIPLSAQIKYTSTKYGVSFKYPNGYGVTHGELRKDDLGLGYLGPIPMEFPAPGGVRLVTLEAQTDSYHGTDLVNAFFTVSVNRFLTRDECQQFSNGATAPLAKKIHRVQYRGVEHEEAGMSHQSDTTYYHGFVKGVCYELGYGVATAGFGAVETLKQVDRGEVSGILRGILQSVKVHPPRNITHFSNSPTIRSFDVTPLPTPANSYRISWDIKNAARDQVFIATSCADSLTITDISSGKESPFPCEVFKPVKPAKGSLDFKYTAKPGRSIQETIRIFAAGRNAASKTTTVPLPVSQ